ncbi:MAG TPA: class F sortase [Arthrobacter sp.]
MSDVSAGEDTAATAPSLRGPRSRIIAGGALVAAALAVMVSVTVGASTPGAGPAAAPSVAATQSIPAIFLPAAVAPPAPVGSPPLHITYPAIGMNQGILPLAPEAGAQASIIPPITTSAYWLIPYGSPGSADTTYIVGHSWEGLDTAFNHLSSVAKRGDRITITTAAGVGTYTVTGLSTENKSTLKDSPIWNKVPGRLILVSCYTADLWGTNMIVTADLEPAH